MIYRLISAIDELDVFGYYKKHGNQKIEMDVTEFVITDYTQEFDSKYQKKDKDFLQKYKQ